jgi:hypothetical protein
MGKLTTADVILSIVFIATAIGVLVIAYLLFIKRFKRAKMVSMNNIRLVTSQYNVFKTKTKFLLEAPKPCWVKVELQDSNDKTVAILVDEILKDDEFPFDFDPTLYDKGKYSLYLTSDNVKIQRIITIA